MLDVVFSDSACGSLKAAQHFGEGKYNSGCIGITLSNGEATEEEIAQAQRHAGVILALSCEYNLIRICGGDSNWNIARNDSSAQSAHNTLMVMPQQEAENYMVRMGRIMN